MPKIKAILVDPFTVLPSDSEWFESPVKHIEIDSGLQGMYDGMNFMGAVGNPVTTIEGVHPQPFQGNNMDPTDTIYANENGRIDGPVHAWTHIKGFRLPIAGRLLIVGTDEAGNAVDAKSTTDQVLEQVRFGHGGIDSVFSKDSGQWERNDFSATMELDIQNVGFSLVKAHVLDIWHQKQLIDNPIIGGGLEDWGSWYQDQVNDILKRHGFTPE